MKEKETDLIRPEDVAGLLNIPAPVFQHWLNRGFVPHEVVTRGGRAWRRFRPDQVFHVIIMAAICRQGLDPSVATQIAAPIAEALLAATQQDEAATQAEKDIAVERRMPLLLRAVGKFITFWKKRPGVLLVSRKSGGEYVGQIIRPDTTVGKAFNEAGSEGCLIVNLRSVVMQADEMCVRFGSGHIIRAPKRPGRYRTDAQ
ncbi:MAG: hypothetical protein WCC59_07910, partial [Terriglobales bacterium]